MQHKIWEVVYNNWTQCAYFQGSIPQSLPHKFSSKEMAQKVETHSFFQIGKKEGV